MVDLSSPDAPEQCQTVEQVLDQLNLRDKPVITALNKIDGLLSNDRQWDESSALEYLADHAMGENTVLISAVKRWGLDHLIATINEGIKRTSSV